ncbi:hypothetical protein GCM10007385_38550 [Tateyamaria omphalii]|uniref:hypothetical protein n=1 Tax=Tateyamaria omphalii TaxID=299262 RepID=UPI001677B0AF|nr:hypothetical protein [Tateyamaria omphalii]GGX65687.1 hypothetical protein GCM10007385_38550 [Tateyamaria omphalii]
MARLKHQNPILLILWGILLAASIVALFVGFWEQAFVALLTLALCMAPLFLASWYSITVPVPFLIATTLFISGSIFMGEAFDFYERVWWWDLALHGASAVGFGLIGFLFIFMLFEGDRFAAPPVTIAFLSFCLAVTVGSIWEIFEYAMDTIFGLNMQKSGLHDTMGDLIVNGIGALVGAVSGYFYLKGRDRRLLAPFIGQFVDANRNLYHRAKGKLRR